VQYRRNDMSRWLRGSDARRVTTLAAAALLARGRANMLRDTGATAESGRLIHGIGGRRKDRVMVTVAFGVDAVRQQFGNKHRKATRPITRAAVER
jgi:hypothetical protein